MATNLDEGYRLVIGTPSLSEYLNLRNNTGLSPKSEAQALACVAGSWYACYIVHEESNEAVAMGRVIGDGGWYFHIIDMAVLPAHRKRGLGGLIMEAMLEKIKSSAPPGAYVNLVGSQLGKLLYSKYGFVETAPSGIGMELRMPYE